MTKNIRKRTEKTRKMTFALIKRGFPLAMLNVTYISANLSFGEKHAGG